MNINLFGKVAELPPNNLASIKLVQELIDAEESGKLKPVEIAIKEFNFLMTVLGKEQFEDIFETSDINSVDFNKVSPAVVYVLYAYTREKEKTQLEVAAERMSDKNLVSVVKAAAELNGID